MRSQGDPAILATVRIVLDGGGVSRIALLVLAIAACDSALHSQPDRLADHALIHSRWGVEDGLPINSVYGLVQDGEGFIWAATLAGLVRFDGIRFKGDFRPCR